MSGWPSYLPSLRDRRRFIEVRERAGLTRGELAKRADTTKSSVEALEEGRIPVIISSVARRLAAALGVATGELFDPPVTEHVQPHVDEFGP